VKDRPYTVHRLLFLTFVSVAIHAANPLPQVLSCGKEGSVGGLGAGTDLTRHAIDLTRFPEAVCNDGTGAIFYYGASTKPEDRNKWILFLQGGGSCVDGQTCAQRWCSVDTNYGFDKMSTSIAKPQIRGVGFLNPASANKFGSWNRVLIYYCSSDSWSGTAVRTLQAVANDGSTREYQIHFKGARILDAVIDTLRNAPASSRRRAARHDIGTDADASWPDLDEATAVILAGSSAGGVGTKANMDRVGAKLHATNPDLDYRAVVDASYLTLAENRNFTISTYCAKDPVNGCSYEAFTKATEEAIDGGLYGARTEESCLQWHTANAPGTEWRCGDGEHVFMHHATTPFFLRQDLLDPQVGGVFVDANFGTPADFAMAVESELRNLQTPEEPHETPGLFVPQCADHESFTTNEPVFDVMINGVTWHDAVWNWFTHAQPQQLIRHFTGTASRAPECP